MVITTFIIVILRYVFDVGWIALQESVTYMHAMVFLVGAAYTMQQEAHVRVDIFYSKLSTKHRAWIDLLGGLFLLMPMMLFVAWISWEYVLDSWNVLEGSREASGLPGVYLLKSLILLMAVLLVLQSIAQIMRSLQIIKGEQ
jgi:TRAP-type mannitol/chloroaromatic compound transport system permease small subunit